MVGLTTNERELSLMATLILATLVVEVICLAVAVAMTGGPNG
jgi:hypothetical protein